MDALQDKYIGTLWAEHFPKHHNNPASKTLCLTLSHIIRNKAQVSLPFAGPADKLSYVLTTLGIPKDQFYEVDKSADA